MLHIEWNIIVFIAHHISTGLDTSKWLHGAAMGGLTAKSDLLQTYPYIRLNFKSTFSLIPSDSVRSLKAK